MNEPRTVPEIRSTYRCAQITAERADELCRKIFAAEIAVGVRPLTDVYNARTLRTRRRPARSTTR